MKGEGNTNQIPKKHSRPSPRLTVSPSGDTGCSTVPNNNRSMKNEGLTFLNGGEGSMNIDCVSENGLEDYKRIERGPKPCEWKCLKLILHGI